jgi:signal transduction histidine kinase
MSPEVQARVFEPFFTTKGADGTGLGLAMVFATMQRHLGSVTLESTPGQGAAFTLLFPVSALAVPAPE